MSIRVGGEDEGEDDDDDDGDASSYERTLYFRRVFPDAVTLGRARRRDFI